MSIPINSNLKEADHPPSPKVTLLERLELNQGLMNLDTQSKLVVVIVGLPARGKSYIVKKLKRYLSWLGLNVKVFNVGDRRRRLSVDFVGATNDSTTIEEKLSNQELEMYNHNRHSSSFFDPNNAEAFKKREEIAMQALDEVIAWVREKGLVAIHDATNSTIRRRQNIIDRLEKEKDVKLLFIESICNDDKILDANIKMKTLSPDYVGIDPAVAEADFRKRLKNYELSYETIDGYEEKRQVQYCKIIDVGSKIITYNINGFLEGQCVFYLMNMNLQPRVIYITRHGESNDNIVGKIGGDASLSPQGIKYGKDLTKFIQEHHSNFQKNIDSNGLNTNIFPEGTMNGNQSYKPKETQKNLEIWTSMLKRTLQTVQFFDHSKVKLKKFNALNELYSGLCEGMTYSEIPKQYPREFSDRSSDKLFTRYPGIHGESYVDVIHRLQHIIVELERMHNSVLIVTHRAVTRTLISYFMDISIEEMPFLNIPIGHVYACELKPHGNELSVYKWNEDDGTFSKTNNDTLYKN
ncbi:hypothetical protein BB559_000001 [Furculomyces boomerangus]|uniref:6-phosphofructo-2-kinase domain-containing protein n=2 Tax=Harpellales TaxID=61421 RepID=A0A2T9Z6L9_9FUNG|nr:hypothetical protein BB559_000001 [Furculomyces boomerangus]PVZ99376.1 hypothetical protein BB558_004615 [Smittium angustum]